MNKIVLGSALVAVIGGVPGATYLLTRSSEDKNTSSRIEEVPKTDSSECNPDGEGKTCPEAEPVKNGKGAGSSGGIDG